LLAAFGKGVKVGAGGGEGRRSSSHGGHGWVLNVLSMTLV
jgi:hypothetical protein